MGGFTAKFVRAAAICARRLEGTLYARYYDLPIEEVRSIAAALDTTPTLLQRVKKTVLRAPGPVPAFGALCERRAVVEPGEGGFVARNGRIIEQQQILTTQNLVPLLDAAELPAEDLPELAWRSFSGLVRRVQIAAPRRIHRLRAAKNAAYAWRQAIAYLSLSPPGAVDPFLERAREHVAEQREPYRARLEPILTGLAEAHAGSPPTVRLLGWSSGPHPLLDEPEPRSRPGIS